MEKIKLNNGMIFEIPVCGIYENLGTETLKVTVLPGELSLTQVEEMFLDTEAVSRMELLSESDEVLKVMIGYQYMASIEKMKNADIGYTQTENALEDTEKMPEPLLADVVMVTLKKASEVEKRLEALEKTQELQDGAIMEMAEMIGGE